MARRFRLARTLPGVAPEDRVLDALYGGTVLPVDMVAPMPSPVEQQVYGDPQAERSAILLSRLLRETRVPQERSKFGFVE